MRRAIFSKSTSLPICFPREWTPRILTRPWMSGRSTVTCRSKRPGRSRALSSTCIGGYDVFQSRTHTEDMLVHLGQDKVAGWNEWLQAGSKRLAKIQGDLQQQQYRGTVWLRQAGKEDAIVQGNKVSWGTGRTSGRLVAARTMTPVLPSKPSISVSSWLMVCRAQTGCSHLQPKVESYLLYE